MEPLLVLAAGLLFLVAVVLLRGAGARRRQAGLPRGRVVYRDTGGEPARPLFSNRYRLTGRPDYLVMERDTPCPVEVKPGRVARQPYDGDMLQLGAYCLLVEETEHRRPPHGYLRYADRTFEIPYTDELRDAVLDALDDIRHDLCAADVAPNHVDPARCRACGFRDDCDAALA
jgi:CRISPR-associated exonuclease Cas4